MMNIAYANQPDIGIPMALAMVKKRSCTNVEYISAVVYLGYRMLDKLYTNMAEYETLHKKASDYIKQIGHASNVGYRWYLSFNLLNACINKNPSADIENLKTIYNIGLTDVQQVCNFSKIATLIYHYIKDEDLRQNLVCMINNQLFQNKNLEDLSKNTITNVVLPYLSNDGEIYKKSYNKYKNWHIHKHYLNTLEVYRTKDDIYL